MAGSREHGAASNCSRHAAQWHEAEKHAVRLASLRDLHASRDIDHKSAIVILRQHTQSADGSSNHGRDIPHGNPTYKNRCAPRGVRSYAYPEHRSEPKYVNCAVIGVGKTDKNAAHYSGVDNHCVCRYDGFV